MPVLQYQLFQQKIQVIQEPSREDKQLVRIRLA